MLLATCEAALWLAIVQLYDQQESACVVAHCNIRGSFQIAGLRFKRSAQPPVLMPGKPSVISLATRLLVAVVLRDGLHLPILCCTMSMEQLLVPVSVHC